MWTNDQAVLKENCKNFSTLVGILENKGHVEFIAKPEIISRLVRIINEKTLFKSKHVSHAITALVNAAPQEQLGSYQLLRALLTCLKGA